MSRIASAFANGELADEPMFATVMFRYPAGEARAETVNSSHFDGSLWAVRRMNPLTVLVESSKVSSTVVQVPPRLSRRSARMTVAAFWVAFESRSTPAPGSASVVVVEKV